MGSTTEVIRQIKIRLYTRLVRRYGERALTRHLEKIIDAVDRRARFGRG